MASEQAIVLRRALARQDLEAAERRVAEVVMRAPRLGGWAGWRELQLVRVTEPAKQGKGPPFRQFARFFGTFHPPTGSKSCRNTLTLAGCLNILKGLHPNRGRLRQAQASSAHMKAS